MYIVSSIKTFQMIGNLRNTSENLPKFVIFPDILPFNSKWNLHCLFFQNCTRTDFVELNLEHNDV